MPGREVIGAMPAIAGKFCADDMPDAAKLQAFMFATPTRVCHWRWSRHTLSMQRGDRHAEATEGMFGMLCQIIK